MSFRDRSPIPLKVKIGCLFYGLVGALVSGFFLIVAAMSDCARQPDGSGCENDALIRFAMFPGSLLLFVFGGVILAYFVTRDID